MALGLALVVASSSIVGLPPFAGFIGKLMILGASRGLPATPVVWAVVLGTGLLMLLALVRAGSALFWQPGDARATQGVATPSALVVPSLLLACGVALAVFAAPVKRFADAAARQLADTPTYAARVLGDARGATARPLRPGGPR
jgi:multicomponent K+:H+ antiporter subunit D